MRQSVMSVVFATALFFECYALAAAMPMSKGDEGPLEQDAFSTLFGEETMEHTLGGEEPLVVSKNGSPKVIVMADAGLWKNLRAMDRRLSFYKLRAGENGLSLERRETEQEPDIVIIKKDSMRCMVGRVYRPCWE